MSGTLIPKSLVLPPQASAPASPAEGELYRNAEGALTSRVGSDWVPAMPPGMISDYAGTTAPAGWLLAYGQQVSRTTYAALFAAIGVTFGAGDGSTTFHLPDTRGRVAAGKDDMGGAAASRLQWGITGTTLGAAGGMDSVTLTEDELPSHTHLIDHDHASVTSGAGTSHTHGDTFAASGSFATSTHRHVWLNSGGQTFNSGGTGITPSRIQTTAGASNFVLRQDGGVNQYVDDPTATATPGITGAVSAEAAHTHAVNLPNFTGSSGSIGLDNAHSNLQPTIVFNKIIKT